jgi:hypothetical protein
MLWLMVEVIKKINTKPLIPRWWSEATEKSIEHRC